MLSSVHNLLNGSIIPSLRELAGSSREEKQVGGACSVNDIEKSLQNSDDKKSHEIISQLFLSFGNENLDNNKCESNKHINGIQNSVPLANAFANQ